MTDAMFPSQVIFVSSAWSAPSEVRRRRLLELLGKSGVVRRTVTILENGDGGTVYPDIDAITNGYGEVIITDAEGKFVKVYGAREDFSDLFPSRRAS